MKIYDHKRRAWNVSSYVFNKLRAEGMIEEKKYKNKTKIVLVNEGAYDRLIFWLDKEEEDELARYIAIHEYPLRDVFEDGD